MSVRSDRLVWIAGSFAAVLLGALLASGISPFRLSVALGSCALLGFALFALIHPSSAFLVFLFLIPLNRPVTLAEVGGRTLYLSLPDLLFVACALAYFAERVLTHRPGPPTGLKIRWLKQPPVLCLAGLAIFCLGSWTVTAVRFPETFWPSLLSMLRLFRFPAYYLLGTQLAVPGVKRYWRCLLLSGAVSISIGLVQYAYPDTFAAIWGAPDEFGWADRLYAGFAAGPNLYAAYLGILFCFALSLWVFCRKEGPSLLGLFVLMAGSIFCLGFTLSRGGLITVIAATLALLLSIPTGRGQIIAISAALLLAGLLYQPSALRERVQAAVEGVPGPSEWEGFDYTVWRRLELAHMGWDELMSSPVVGRGFRPIAPEIAAEGYTETTLHNMYLDIGVKAGGPALICFLAFLGYSLRDLYRAGGAAADPWLKAFLYALGASTIGLMASSFAQENFSDDNLAPLIWALLGVAACLARLEQRKYASGAPATAVQRAVQA